MNMASNENARIELPLNVTAPDFSLVDIYDREVTLSKYRGKKMFIGFFRHAGCPFCNLRVHFLQKQREMLQERNMEMIFFFQSSASLLKSSIFHREINPIPVIADPERVTYQTYGIEDSTLKSIQSHLTQFLVTAIRARQQKVPTHLMKSGESFGAMPAEFLLDEELIIRKLHYSNGLNDRMEIRHILDFAEGT